MSNSAEHVDQVQARYVDAARKIAADPERPASTGCFGPDRYSVDDIAALGAVARSSLGCGNPVAVAELHPGETVLDLGSGAGLDVLLSARRVGPTGRAIGLDMTDEMLALAERHAREAGATNVEFRKGRIEAIPLPAGSVDVVISNCVLALSTDAAQVLREIARVLRPGGRIGISDLIVDAGLPVQDRRRNAVECLDTALTEAEYAGLLGAAGLNEIDIRLMSDAGNGLHTAIVRAVKPAR